jgi:integrase
MDYDLSLKSTIKSLEVRREPYWNRVQGIGGLYLGFRKLTVGGTWIARWRNDEGKQQYRSLGSGHSYDQAVKAAKEWAKALSSGVETFDSTVADVCESYVKHQRLHKSEAAAYDAEIRFKRLVYGKPIGKLPLSKLTTTTLRAWLNKQVVTDGDEDEERRSKDTANRNLTAIKAALNMALKDRLVRTDEGWKTVTAFEGVSDRRKHFLTSEQRQALVNACVPDLRDLVMALLFTPARPGEIAKATAQDFDRINGALTLRGKTGERIVTLSTQAVAFFTEKAKGKIGNALLFTRHYGGAWSKKTWAEFFKEAVKKAGLPDDVVMYSLRHTAISQLIQGGVDVFLIAKMAGTSVGMIEKHYGHLRHDKTRQRLDLVQSI